MRARAGVAVRDVSPAPGAAMSGFVARTAPALGTHDPLTVRALVVAGTGVVTVDVVGLHEDTCRRIRERCPGVELVVHATHTHGGPVSMAGRLGEHLDAPWLTRLEDAAVAAVHEAAARREPVDIAAAHAPDPGVTRNRRRAGGPVDTTLPVVTLTRPGGSLVATVVSYACHPVVLGADNVRFTADYPGVVREHLEAELGGVALFLTGCAGDTNTGHTAAASISTVPAAGRTYEAAAEVGGRIARAALDGLGRHGAVLDGHRSTALDGLGHLGAALDRRSHHDATLDGHRDAADRRRAQAPGPGTDVTSAGGKEPCAVRTEVELALDVPPPDRLREEAARWQSAAHVASDESQRVLFTSWARWAAAGAERADPQASAPDGPRPARWRGQVTVLRWGPATIACLPGEPFAATSHAVRESLGPGVTVVAGYCDGCPGYLPPAEEYPHGGYEVEDAHRYYGMPGPFAAGSAERLVAALRDAMARPGSS